MALLPDPLFLQVEPGPLGQRFALHHRPQSPPQGLVVYVHPFAEEMNKSRRMAALQSRALAEAGFAVLQLDLLGCGDSDGELQDASWAQWVADVAFACRWLQAQHPHAGRQPMPLWLWGLRAGALLAAEAARQCPEPCHLLFWQPANSGKQLLQQFLRLKAAADLQGGQAKAVMEATRKTLADGGDVDVAGYRLPSGISQGLERATLLPLQGSDGCAPGLRRLVWLELSTLADASLSPVAQSGCTHWQAAGWAVRNQVVAGPSFWQSTEIEDAPALLTDTLLAMKAAPAQSSPPSPVGHCVTTPQSGDTATPPASAPAGTCRAEALRFRCEGESLIGILHQPDPAQSSQRLGVVIVVGGPQVRVGSHRQFVQVARALADDGYPVLRYDVRGMGDSTGAQLSFEQLTPDIGAAIDELLRQCPQLQQVVLWGLCDGASASLLYLAERHGDARVAGLCVLNPWVRSELSLARTQVKHYYTRRVVDPAFWRKLLRGGVRLGAARELLHKLGTAMFKGPAAPSGAAQPFHYRMAAAWRGFKRPILLLLSGDDYTAREFSQHAATDPAWAGALSLPGVSSFDLAGADHTFSAASAQAQVLAHTRAWLAALSVNTAASTGKQ